jgi:phage terminase large subunit GpA-like protein
MRLTCFRRAGWRCERCGERRPLQAHHRQLLSQGGPDALSNLAALCAECHAWAHAHPWDAQLGGWIVLSWADPATRAMFLHDGQLAVPDDEGGYRWQGRTND